MHEVTGSRRDEDKSESALCHLQLPKIRSLWVTEDSKKVAHQDLPSPKDQMRTG